MKWNKHVWHPVNNMGTNVYLSVKDANLILSPFCRTAYCKTSCVNTTMLLNYAATIAVACTFKFSSRNVFFYMIFFLRRKKKKNSDFTYWFSSCPCFILLCCIILLLFCYANTALCTGEFFYFQGENISPCVVFPHVLGKRHIVETMSWPELSRSIHHM